MNLPVMHASIIMIFAALLCGCSRTEQPGKSKDSTSVRGPDTLGVALPSDLKRSDDKVSFSYAFKEGDSFGYSILVKETVKITRDTVAEVNRQDIEYRYRFRVLESQPDGGFRLEATCTRVTFTGNYTSPDSKRSMTFDSDEKNEPQKLTVFARWYAPVNLPYEVVLSRLGAIENVSRTEEIVKRLMGKDYSTSKQKAREMIGKDYEENGLKNIIQLAFQRYQDRPIAVDSFWTHSWAGALGFLKLEHKAFYTYKGFQSTGEGDLAHIAIRLQSRYTGSEKLDTGQGIATIDAFNVKGQGVTVFNMDAGRCASRRFGQSIMVKFFVEIPKEIKEAAPDQYKDFWLTENATVENTITAMDK